MGRQVKGRRQIATRESARDEELKRVKATTKQKSKKIRRNDTKLDRRKPLTHTPAHWLLPIVKVTSFAQRKKSIQLISLEFVRVLTSRFIENFHFGFCPFLLPATPAAIKRNITILCSFWVLLCYIISLQPNVIIFSMLLGIIVVFVWHNLGRGNWSNEFSIKKRTKIIIIFVMCRRLFIAINGENSLSAIPLKCVQIDFGKELEIQSNAGAMWFYYWRWARTFRPLQSWY